MNTCTESTKYVYMYILQRVCAEVSHQNLAHDVQVYVIVAGVEVCPGESANLTCTVTDTTGGFGSTIWKGDSSVFVCASGNVLLSHTIAMATGDCEPLASGRIVSADGKNFTSVLTVTAPDMGGSSLPVQCTFPQPLPAPPVVVMEYNVNITGKLLLAYTYLQVRRSLLTFTYV